MIKEGQGRHGKKKKNHSGGINETGKVLMTSSDAFLPAFNVVLSAVKFTLLAKAYCGIHYPVWKPNGGL